MSCTTESTNQKNEEGETLKYLFMGHIYDETPIIDKRITKGRLGSFNQIWLGGDLTHDSAVDWKLHSLDSVLRIKSETTQWAFGNHDIVSGRQNLLDYLGESKSYGATYINGITLLVFDSNYNDQGDCKEVNEQTQYIKMVCDTIAESSHFILMGHHVPWGNIELVDAWSFANTSIQNRVFQCDTFQNFKQVIYPSLVDVQNKNIQVLSLAGDLGQKQSTFEYQTEEGIFFLGNGGLSTNDYNSQFSNYNSNDSVLIFYHKPAKRQLTWQFVNVGND